MSGVAARCRIAVVPETEFHARRSLFAVMSELYEVDFHACSAEAASGYDGAIIWDVDGSALARGSGAICRRDCLVIAPQQGPRIEIKSGTARFTASPSLDPVFRNEVMEEGGITAFHAVVLGEDDELLCTLDSEPCWSMRRMEQTSVSMVALGPEEMDSQEPVYAHFNRRRWLRLLPLLHFLKQISRRTGWEAPPLRACIMFDDPNLHGRTYGHIDLREIARHARQFAYHASFAMVPFDGWHADASVVEWVKQNQSCMSLCMHGNNHTKNELAVPRDHAVLMGLFAQGLQRVRRFEERTGMPVSRVMVPPYGAFADRAVGPMLSLGYEAVCVSRSSLTAWNRERLWNPGFGHSIAELLDGLPVIPRHVMGREHRGSYRLAAFLGQPIIPHGHHQDCAGGLGLVEDVVASIQGLGNVTWMDMTAMSRSNYLTKREGDCLRVKMMARRITVPVPEGVSEVIVERPWIGGEGAEEELHVNEGGRASFSKILGRSNVRFLRDSQGGVELVSPAPEVVDFRRVQAPRLDLKIAGRRLLAETRDRLLPLIPKLRIN